MTSEKPNHVLSDTHSDFLLLDSFMVSLIISRKPELEFALVNGNNMNQVVIHISKKLTLRR
jgi:hypothetical protein